MEESINLSIKKLNQICIQLLLVFVYMQIEVNLIHVWVIENDVKVQNEGNVFIEAEK